MRPAGAYCGRPRGDDEVNGLSQQARARRLLSPAEEVTLARRIERGDLRAKDLMIESNLRLVFALARTYRGRGVPFADLVQEGTIGLVRAVERFDHRRGLKFSTYAVWWIRRSMRDALAGAPVIQLPVRAGRRLAAVRCAEAELERTDRRSPSNAAIAQRTGLSPECVSRLRTAARVTASLDQPIDEGATPLGELLPDETAVDPFQTVIGRETLHSVPTMLRLLPPRHRTVLERRYGIGRHREQTHAEIGALLGVSEERSRQLERQALHRLRSIAGAPLAAVA
jgi:RNA polymerase primary sigma factor